MHSRAARRPKLRKMDLRVPVVVERGVGWDTPLFDSVDRALLRSIDGHATVHVLATALGRTEEQVANALAKLERRGFVAMREPTKRTPSSPPKRLASGMRPAMKTLPAEDSIAEVARTLASDGTELVATEPPPFDPPTIEALDDPEQRLTLPGIGPHLRTGTR